MKKYYLYIGARQYGPFSRAELKHQHIHRETPVWYEGLNEWVKAGSVEDLQEILPVATPPPFVVANFSSPSRVSQLPARRACRLKQRFFSRVLFIVCLLVLGVLVLTVILISS